MIAVYSGDRAWRLAVEQALRAHSVAVRSASRPAELAKCLADGLVRVVVVGAAADDHVSAGATITSQGVLTTTPGESTESVVRRALALM
ncbi:hypothetical protein [Gemmatimonas sp.]|jgi:hypothetical protein|uniref:hypothetical protein n=1 Tax=Gemmatimonas sp. TaxID=1962908 RepID=UPI0037C055CE